MRSEWKNECEIEKISESKVRPKRLTFKKSEIRKNKYNYSIFDKSGKKCRYEELDKIQFTA